MIFFEEEMWTYSNEEIMEILDNHFRQGNLIRKRRNLLKTYIYEPEDMVTGHKRTASLLQQIYKLYVS